MQSTDLGAYGRVVSPNATGGPVDRAAHALCSNQRVRNTGSYQSFSGLGLIIIIVFGSLIIILSLTVETCVATLRRRRARYQPVNNEENADSGGDHREIARIADRMLQLQRMALVAAQPQTKWEGRMDQVPYTANPEARFPLPVRVTGDDFRYGRGEESDGMELKEGGDGSSEDVQQPAVSSVPSIVSPVEEQTVADTGGQDGQESEQVENRNAPLMILEDHELITPNSENLPQ